MLNKNPLNRLCKMRHIKADPYFSGFSWEELISLTIKPPYIPKLNKEEKEEPPIPYINYLKKQKEWKPPKNAFVSKSEQIEFDEWFKKF